MTEFIEEVNDGNFKQLYWSLSGQCWWTAHIWVPLRMVEHGLGKS